MKIMYLKSENGCWGVVKYDGVAGFSPEGAEPPRLSAAAPQHPGVTTPAWEGVHEMRGVYTYRPSACASEQNTGITFGGRTVW